MAIDLQRLFRLRAVAGLFGEMDRAGWWNTPGVLGARGAAVYKRGLPETHFLARVRVVAWSWKLASLGVPVLLVYLGFLNAVKMVDQGEPFADRRAWERAVRSHVAGVVPEQVCGAAVDVRGTPLRAVIPSVAVPI